jgi:putative spermidine/putrescine transport system ATP-binding protein
MTETREREPTSESAATSPPSRPALRLAGVSKRYGSTSALEALNLELREGEFLTVLGQSGSGKTTLLKLIAGFEQPNEGVIQIAGTDVTRRPPRERDVGMVFQNYALFPHMTVGDNVAYGLKRRGWPRERRADQVRDMLALVGLSRLEDRYPRQLSGGQQQRVAVARALAFAPRLLLMDEPLGALDRALRLSVQRELRQIHRTTGCSVVYVTHDRDEALALADRLAVFHDGRLVDSGTPADVYLRPTTAYAARLLADANVFPVRVARDAEGHASVAIAGHRASVLRTGGPRASQLAIPRSALTLEPPPGPGLALDGTVVDRMFLGETARVEVEVAGLGVLTAETAQPAALRLGPGDTASLHLDTSRCLLVD